MLDWQQPLAIEKLASVTVTFNPDLTVLSRQMASLHEVGHVVIVDNGSRGEIVAELRRLVLSLPQATLVQQSENIGLAGALNEGIEFAMRAGATSLLLLDQDSLFSDSAPAQLLLELEKVQLNERTLCCVGPALRDPTTKTCHGFHYIEHGWRWARAYPATDADPIPVSNLNGSGSIMSASLVRKVGRLDDHLFIDHVDTDWSFRVLSHGFGLFGVPRVVFEHQMGEGGRRLWLLGWRVWPERSPARHYYLFRNTIRLLRRPFVPLVWKFWAVGKMVATFLIVTCTDRRRRQQASMMWKGILDALGRARGL